MNYAEVFALALDCVERVKLGQKIEDMRVELKSEWTAPEKMARQLAGSANAARGSEILWIVGLDETKGAVGVNEDLAVSLAALKAQFDGPFPRLEVDAAPRVGDKTIQALLFSTDRAPYVVRNPLFGTSGMKTPIALEVPWREGTTVRSATHEDLIRILSPIAAQPELEILEGHLGPGGNPPGPGLYYLALHLHVYVDCDTDMGFVIPFHRCGATLSFPGRLEPVPFKEIYARLSASPVGGHSPTMSATPDEIHIGGPGRILVVCHGPFDLALVGMVDADFEVTLHAKRFARAMVLRGRLRRTDEKPGPVWKYGQPEA